MCSQRVKPHTRNPEPGKETERFHDFCRFNNLYPCVWKPTRITTTTATVTDNILTSETGEITTGILTADVADHLAPFVILPSKKQGKDKPETPKYVEFRVMSEENIQNLRKELESTNWNEVLMTLDTNKKTESFQRIFAAKLDTHCPKKRVKFNKNIHHVDEAMTQGLLVSRKTKQALFNKWIRTRDADLKRKHSAYNTLYNTLIRKSKSILHKQKFEEKYKNAREMWQYTNQLLSRKRKNKDASITLNLDGKQTADQQEVADAFNTFFSSIGQELVNEFDVGKDEFRKYMPVPTGIAQEMKFLEITSSDYDRIIASMKAKKSTGFDDISNKLIKDLREAIKVPLMDIINMSLCTGVVPSAWKIAKIIPLHKGGNKQDMNNYRPISLLSALSKIMEKVVHHQTYNYVENKILTVSQFGFRKQRETAQAILAFMKNMKENDSKAYHMAIFIDIKKAFDTVSHELLLEKMSILGIRGTENLWFRNYLSGRLQSTVLGSKRSKSLSITCGVPQGSILGPLLFLIYINDMPNATKLLSILFADDTTYQLSANNLDELEKEANLELAKAEKWFKANFLTLHPKKTRYILFQTKKQRNNPPQRNLKIILMNQQVQRVSDNDKETAFKFLGLWIDENLNWQEHVRKTTAKVRQLAYSMTRLKNVISSKHQTVIYKGLIKPVIEYGIAIWGHAISKDLTKAHKKIVRVINHEPRHSHVEPLLKQMNCLQLTDLYRQRVLTTLYKVKHDQVPELLYHYCKWLPEDSRRWYQIVIPVKQNKIDRILPQYHQFNTWNKFFDESSIELLRFEVSGKSFGKNIKNHIMNTYYSECEHKFCYSCSERAKLEEEKRRKQLQKQQEAEAEQMKRFRQEEKERNWYLL